MSLKNVVPRRTYKERGQLASRNRLGELEKHKDYVLRAKDYHKKEDRIKLLQEKAFFRNPDEFYFKMAKTKTKDGVHRIGGEDDKYTPELLKLMKTQDLGYVMLKKTAESKKLDKLRANLQMLDAPSVNKQTIFLDEVEEAREFDAAKHFDTLPELVSRRYNRPTIETIKTKEILAPRNPKELKKIHRQRLASYRELLSRSEREQKMEGLMLDMHTQKQLMGKGRRKKVSPGEDGKPAVFKWQSIRKR
eukprot:GILK01005105.1.p1 GENE.GILK01005105.1~~GILK01005105.1.p1  ORF type:complete len:248 (-),score=58.02 GILK01005105.1:140-883(-)